MLINQNEDLTFTSENGSAAVNAASATIIRGIIRQLLSDKVIIIIRGGLSDKVNELAAHVTNIDMTSALRR